MRITQEFHSDLLGEKYACYRHPSGLPIYVFPKQLSTAYALLATNFGAIDDLVSSDGKPVLPEGTAHFLEHKLFANEDGSDAFERFSDLGADANAFTSHTRTVYLFSCTDHFEESLTELLSFVTHPYFTEENVARERAIIDEEIRMCRDNPYERCYYNMLRGLYRAHPVRKDICGTHASVAAITPQTLYAAYDAFYGLSNMKLVVCGDVTPEAVFALCDRVLPQTKKELPARRPSHAEPAAVHRAQIGATGTVARPLFSIGIKDASFPDEPRARAARDATMAVLQEILFGSSSELYRELTESGMIAPGLSVDYVLTRDFGFQQIAGEADDPQAVLQKIKAAVEKAKQSGISQADFERCRRVEYAEYIKSFDSGEEIANTLLAFLFEETPLFEYADIVREMRLADVQALLETCFDEKFYTLSVVFPAEKEG